MTFSSSVFLRQLTSSVPDSRLVDAHLPRSLCASTARKAGDLKTTVAMPSYFR